MCHLPGIDITTPTHLSVLSETYHSFRRLVAQLPKKKRSKGVLSKADGEAATDQQRLQKQAKLARLMHVLLLRSSTFELEVGSLELNVSAYTSHIEPVLRTSLAKAGSASEPREDINVIIPTTTYRLQNRPSMNECLVDVAGARVVYRSTKQGRAAVIRHLSQLLKL